MKDSIIQRCPCCGNWCQAEYKGFFDKWIKTIKDQSSGLADWGGKYFGDSGKIVGGVIGGYSGFVNGSLNAIAGEHYQFRCPRCNSEWSTNDDADDEIDTYYQNRWAIQKANDFGNRISSKSKTERDNYIHQLESGLSNKHNDDESLSVLYDTLAASYSYLGNRDAALSYINQSLSLFPNDPNSRTLKGYILGTGRNSAEAYSAMRELIHYNSSEQGNLYLTPEGITRMFKEIQTFYVEKFMELPCLQRRFLYLISGDIDSRLHELPEDIYVLPIDYLPTNMDFIGAPKEQTLYVCHPYNQRLYIPFDKYELELFRDEKKEFMWIMECLGAKRIAFGDDDSSNDESNYNEEMKVNGGIGYNDGKTNVKAKGGYDTGNNGSSIYEDTDKSDEGKVFERSNIYPYIPKDVVWYPHRQEWQRNCVSRLEGRLSKADFSLASTSTEMISDSNRKKIEAELEVMIVSLNGNYETTANQSKSKKHEYSCNCHVEFYSINDYPSTAKKNRTLETKEKNSKWLYWVLGGIIVALATTLVLVVV